MKEILSTAEGDQGGYIDAVCGQLEEEAWG